MYWAAFRNRKDIVEELIRRGVSPFCKDMQKRNALMAACFAGNFEIVELILKLDYTGDDIARLEKKWIHRDY